MTDTQNRTLSHAQKAFLITGISFVIGFLFDYLLFEQEPGISFSMYILVIVGALGLLSAALGKKMQKQSVMLFIPLFFFAGMVAVRASEFLTFLNIVACAVLLLIIAEASFGLNFRKFFLLDYLKIPFMPFRFVMPMLRNISDLFQFRMGKKDSRTVEQVTRGVVIAVPVLLVFIVLFSSADLIFRKYLMNVWEFDIQEETIVRAVLVLIITLGFIGFSSFMFRMQKAKTASASLMPSFSLGPVESSIIFGSLNLLFLVFIVLQITYLFGGETNISVQGFTYAEYARKGFFELIAVAVISLGLLLVAEKFSERKDTRHTGVFKVLGSALVFQVLLIMTSAFMRLKLYEDAYGFTTQRLYSHAFILLLAIIFLFLLYKIFIDNRENIFALCSFSSLILFLAIMNVLNPDVFIARRNIKHFAVSGKIDEYYVLRLSTDTIREKIQLSQMDIGEEDPTEYLKDRLLSLNNPPEWQSWNLSRSRAQRVLQTHRNKPGQSIGASH